MEIIGFLIQTIGTVLLILIVLHIPLWYIAKKKKIVKKFDYFFPFIPLVFYLIINIIGISKQSISNLIYELVVVVLVTTIGYGVKVYSKYKNLKNILIAILIFIILFVLSMPLIKE